MKKTYVALIALLTLGAAGLAVFVWQLVSSDVIARPALGPRQIAERAELAPQEKSTIALFQTASPSVVYITNINVVRRGWSRNLEKVPSGTGSGFVWDESGYIVTNFHVIQGADAATVTLADGTEHDAKLVGAEPDKDLAVLKIDAAKDLRALPIGTSYDLKVGQSVFAIGNPFGLDHTLTTGVISGLGRENQSISNRPITDMIQTDAAINPGNSGGPLLDSSGRLIGVNTQIISPSGASAGIGFAVPVDTVNRIVPQLIEFGRVKKPGLGVQIGSEDIARRFDVNGVVIVEVSRGSAAAKAGLQGVQRTRRGWRLGDVIQAVNKSTVRSANDLFKTLDQYEVGQEISLTVLRDGKQQSVPIVLQEIR